MPAIRALLCAAAMFLAAAVPCRAAATVSQCLAMAETVPGVTAVAFRPVEAAVAEGSVEISYVGHSTFRIETHEGVVVATDYAGWAGHGVTPRVVTMNRAHETHFTANPDPAIEHVLRGWGEDGAPARHDIEVGDIRIRNVSTDIRGGYASALSDANSIFVFETAGLCIGHLGHLHHDLGPEHVGLIGRLDVVMVPVDGSYTLPHADMARVLDTLKARVVLPMHAFGAATLARFIQALSQDFAVDMRTESSVTLSTRTLPRKPTVMVLPAGG